MWGRQFHVHENITKTWLFQICLCYNFIFFWAGYHSSDFSATKTSFYYSDYEIAVPAGEYKGWLMLTCILKHTPYHIRPRVKTPKHRESSQHTMMTTMGDFLTTVLKLHYPARKSGICIVIKKQLNDIFFSNAYNVAHKWWQQNREILHECCRELRDLHTEPLLQVILFVQHCHNIIAEGTVVTDHVGCGTLSYLWLSSAQWVYYRSIVYHNTQSFDSSIVMKYQFSS